MSHLLAFDAGTGSIRAVLFDLHGNQTAVSQKNGFTNLTLVIQAL